MSHLRILLVLRRFRNFPCRLRVTTSLFWKRKEIENYTSKESSDSRISICCASSVVVLWKFKDLGFAWVWLISVLFCSLFCLPLRLWCLRWFGLLPLRGWDQWENNRDVDKIFCLRSSNLGWVGHLPFHRTCRSQTQPGGRFSTGQTQADDPKNWDQSFFSSQL